jgi:hypothetical protein
VAAPATAAATFAARSAVASSSSALAATIATVLAPVALRFAAFTRQALVGAFARLATFAGWGAFGRRTAHRLVALGHGGPAGEPHAALFIHAKALDPDLVAHLDDVLDLLDAEVG